MNRNIIIAVVVLLIIGGGFLLLNQQAQQPTQQSQTAPTGMEEKSASPTKAESDIMKEKGEATTAVEIKGFAFSPKTITIKAGESIKFTNKDAVGHSATSDDGVFDTGLLQQNESASVKFDKAGTYAYHCTPHPNMKATVVVE